MALRKTSEIERWKAVTGYEELYEVSSLGNVRSLPKRNQKQMLIMSPKISRYRYVLLVKDNKRKMFSVGSLVLTAFKGPRPYKLEVDHINRVKTDDRLTNLRWLSRSQNELNCDRCENSSSGGVAGVNWHTQSQTWRATVSLNGAQKCLGNYHSIAEAAKAVKNFIEKGKP
jgi:hypothetical protein